MRRASAAVCALAAVTMFAAPGAAQDPKTEHILVTGGLIPEGQSFQTTLNLVFTISRWPDAGYQALFGPDPTVIDQVAKAKINEVASAENATGVEFFVEEGFVYLTGTRPYGGSGSGSGVSEGSIMVIRPKMTRTVSGTPVEVDRYYYLTRRGGADRLSVWTRSTIPVSNDTCDIYQYVDLRTYTDMLGQLRGAIYGPEDVADSDDDTAFIEKVVEMAGALGLPTPKEAMPPPGP